MRFVEAEYENGVLRPVGPLSLRSGERVNLVVMRRPDPARWHLARLAAASNHEDVALAEEGLEEWANSLEATERE